MSALEDLDKVVRVVNSCTTSAQNNVAYALVMLYEKKWGKCPAADWLYEAVDANLIRIMEGDYHYDCREIHPSCNTL